MNKTWFDEEDVVFSGHAEERAWERGFTATDVAELLSTPHETFPGDPRLGPDRRVHQFDEVRIVTGDVWPDGSIDVITVMHRTFGSGSTVATRAA